MKQVLTIFITIICQSLCFANINNHNKAFNDLFQINANDVDSLSITVYEAPKELIFCSDFITTENFWDKSSLRSYTTKDSIKMNNIINHLNSCSFHTNTTDNSDRIIVEYKAFYNNGNVFIAPFPVYESTLSKYIKGCIIIFAEGAYRLIWFSIDKKQILYLNEIFNMSDEFYDYILNL